MNHPWFQGVRIKEVPLYIVEHVANIHNIYTNNYIMLQLSICKHKLHRIICSYTVQLKIRICTYIIDVIT